MRSYAVIGSGVSGLTAAHVLGRSAHVTLFEADSRPGGHAHTHDVDLGDGTVSGVDSGFIVHNDRTYPTLLRLFDEVGVDTAPTDMSMSICGGPIGWEYAGGQGMRGIFGDARTSRSPQFWRMLLQIKRFHRSAVSFLESPTRSLDVSIGDWLTTHRFSDTFLEMFARPLVAAVWSCDSEDALDYPAHSLLTFLHHHGMLSVSGSPSWRTVRGGSREYVQRVVKNLPDVRLSHPVTSVRRVEGGVELGSVSGIERFDGAVIATHPDQALAMLAEPTPDESRVLGAMPYSTNPALLHTDTSLLPSSDRVRAAWNYRVPEQGDEGVLVTYDLTRLMRLPSPGGRRILVTLNGSHRVDPAQVLAEMTYAHPLYTGDSLRAQARLGDLGDARVAFAGAYHGWGFHEDGAASGAAAASRLGVNW